MARDREGAWVDYPGKGRLWVRGSHILVDGGVHRSAMVGAANCHGRGLCDVAIEASFAPVLVWICGIAARRTRLRLERNAKVRPASHQHIVGAVDPGVAAIHPERHVGAYVVIALRRRHVGLADVGAGDEGRGGVAAVRVAG